MIFLELASRLLCCVTCAILSFGIISGDSEVISQEAEDEVEPTEVQLVEEEIEEEKFIKPVQNGTISSYFGMRRGKMHQGIDIADKKNTEIYASKSGTIIYTGYSGSYGNLVKIQHSDGYETYYAHCSKILVSLNDYVEQGQLIAKMGATGNATGSHVHFEIRLNGEAINPYEYIY